MDRPVQKGIVMFFHRRVRLFAIMFSLAMMSGVAGAPKADKPAPKKKKPPKPFKWVNPLNADLPGVKHGTFVSSSMKVDVGYCIYLPPDYMKPTYRTVNFPVVYYLHGGRPGSEVKSVKLVNHIHNAMAADKVPDMIYVFVNGGPVSHYNLPDRKHAMGEDVFIKELIPHIEKTYRVHARREARGIEGFSQGGRGTTRITFKHPHLFVSCAPGGAGYATEKRISEDNGKESDSLIFAPGYNTWDLARQYASNPKPALNIQIHVGIKGFNYQNNLEYMKFLDTLKIPYSKVIVPDAPHSARIIYEKKGLEIMRFHAKNFGLIK